MLCTVLVKIYQVAYVKCRYECVSELLLPVKGREPVGDMIHLPVCKGGAANMVTFLVAQKKQMVHDRPLPPS